MSESDSDSAAGFRGRTILVRMVASEFEQTMDSALQEGSKKKDQHMITPGVSKIIFQAIKKKVPKIPRKDRICALLMHETDISPNLNYLPNEDYIIGFEDFGWERTQNVADNGTVFMLRSVYGKWKQPVAFTFHEWPLKKNIIEIYIKDIAKATKDAGLNLISLICTHAGYNIDAVNDLLEGNDVIKIDDQEIVPMFDPCTLILSMRNNLLERNLEFKKEGTTKIAKWEHIEDAYKIDKELSDCLSKITSIHVDPGKVDKSNMTTAIQVFSSTLAGFLSTISGKTNAKVSKNLPIEALETAELITFLDQLFDSVNGEMSENADKPLTGPVSPNSSHAKIWEQAKPMFAQMKFLDEDPETKTQAFEAWPRTLCGFELVGKKLASLGYDSFPARSFNLDPLVSCFDMMQETIKRRAKKKELTCRKFSTMYNLALKSKDISAFRAKEAHCEPDELMFLVSGEDF